MKLVDTFAYHRNNPGVSLDSYVRSKRIELGESLTEKEKIYLDTKYWIYFRDVVLGRVVDGPLVKCYELLESLCKAGVVVCPISEDVFYEITKQTDEDTLSTSITVIDNFSQGVSLITQEERIQAEILHFYYRYTDKGANLYPPEILVWTKTSQSIGSYLPHDTPFSKEEELVIQKAFFDQMWSTTLRELSETIGYRVLNEAPRMPDLSDLLNENAVELRGKISSFQGLFLDEIHFSVEYISSMLTEAMEYMYTKETGNVRCKSDKGSDSHNKSLVNLVCNMFKLGKEGDNFPTLKVGAGIHAAVRMDRKRQFVANDYYDFRHAQAAVPYCDYFFTEKNLRHLLKLNSLSYDRKYNCEIASKPSDALKVLEKIKAKNV